MDKIINLRIFCSTLSNYKGCFVVNLPGTAEVAERTVGTVDVAEDKDGPEMKNMSLVI